MLLAFIIHHSQEYNVCTHVRLFFTFFIFSHETHSFNMKKSTKNPTKPQTKKNETPTPKHTIIKRKVFSACITISILLKGKLRNKFYMLCPNLSSVYGIRSLAKGIAEIRILCSLQCPYAVWEV